MSTKQDRAGNRPVINQAKKMKDRIINEQRVVKKIAQALRLLQSLEEMPLCKHHAFELQLTKGFLLGIIEFGGHRRRYHWLFGIRLLKSPAATNK